MNIEFWPIDQPRDYARNARRITDESVSKMADLLREFGMRQPVVVDRNGVIVIGHRRRRAWKLLGNTEIPVHVAGELTASQARALRISDNRIASDVHTDYDLLKIELGELRDDGIDLALTGMEVYEIEPLLAVAVDEAPAATEGEGDAPPKLKTIKYTPEQYDIVMQAYEKIREQAGESGMSDGRAGELLAADYLSAA